jgi:tetratricopeptide (TPR) repeat protein
MRFRVTVLFAALLAATPAWIGEAWADKAAEARQAELDKLFKALRAAPNETAAGMLEGRIRSLWTQQGSPAALLLLARGEREMGASDDNEAVQDFDAVLALEPQFAEGFNHRAAARAALGDYAGAIQDIQATLELDPRHFTALEGLSHIAEQQGNWHGALEAWRRALDIDPLTPGGLDRLDKLQKKADGEAT